MVDTNRLLNALTVTATTNTQPLSVSTTVIGAVGVPAMLMPGDPNKCNNPICIKPKHAAYPHCGSLIIAQFDLMNLIGPF